MGPMTTEMTRINSRRSGKAQALLEFVIALPFLLFLLMGTFMVGSAMYTGANASTAMKEIVMEKNQLADVFGNTSAKAEDVVEAYNSGGFFLITDGPIDTGTLTFGSGTDPAANPTKVNTVLVARKQVTFPIPSVPPFNFQVTQAINANLIRANNPTNAIPIATLPAGIDKAPMVSRVDPRDYGFDLSQAAIANVFPKALPLKPQVCNPATTSPYTQSAGTLAGGLPFQSSHVFPHLNTPLALLNEPDRDGSYIATRNMEVAAPVDFADNTNAPNPTAAGPIVNNATFGASPASKIPAMNLQVFLDTFANVPNTGCDTIPTVPITSAAAIEAEWRGLAGGNPNLALKMKKACRLQYAARYLNALMAQVNADTGCTASAAAAVNASDINYATSNTPMPNY